MYDYDIDMMRDVLVEEVEEWFSTAEPGKWPPGWMFFVFEEAGFELRDLAEIDDFTAGPFSLAATEQILNASAVQVDIYTRAREAYLDTP